MEIKFRLIDGKTVSKTACGVAIEQVVYKDNFINKNDASVQLCFRENNTSGIIELSMKELEIIQKNIKTEQAITKDKLEQVEKAV